MNENELKINVFIAYAREDNSYLKKLRIFLRPLSRNKTINIWHDGEIVPGTVWENDIKTHLHNADIVLLLVSAYSLDSDYFYDKEMADALERHNQEETIVVPVILSNCMWDKTPLKDLQFLPRDAKPLNNWDNESDAYTNVVRGLDKSIEEVKNRRTKFIGELELAEAKKKEEEGKLKEKADEEKGRKEEELAKIKAKEEQLRKERAEAKKKEEEKKLKERVDEEEKRKEEQLRKERAEAKKKEEEEERKLKEKADEEKGRKEEELAKIKAKEEQVRKEWAETKKKREEAKKKEEERKLREKADEEEKQLDRVMRIAFSILILILGPLTIYLIVIKNWWAILPGICTLWSILIILGSYMSDE